MSNEDYTYARGYPYTLEEVTAHYVKTDPETGLYNILVISEHDVLNGRLAASSLEYEDGTLQALITEESDEKNHIVRVSFDEKEGLFFTKDF